VRLDALQRREAELLDAIEAQEKSALKSDTTVRKLESRIRDLQELNKQAELSHQAALKEITAANERALTERVSSEMMAARSLNGQVVQLQADNAQLQDKIRLLQDKVDASALSELQSNSFQKQLQGNCMQAASEIQRLQATIDDLNKQLQQKCRELEVSAKQCRDLAAISQGAQDMMQRQAFAHVDDKIKLQQLPVLADELKTCKQMLEEEKKRRGAAEVMRDALVREKEALAKRSNENAMQQQILNGLEAQLFNGSRQ
jgi:chromosome segregation ATPase